jgi:hypothetical protein
MEIEMKIRLRRLQYVGHVMRMKDERVPTKAVKGNIEGRSPVVRPGGRLIDTVDRDTKRMLKCKNWRMSAEERGGRMRKIEEVKAQIGL